MDKQEPGKVQILPDFLSLQFPESRDFYFCWGRGKGIQTYPELSSKPLGMVPIASWLCLDQTYMITGSQRKHNIKLVSLKSPIRHHQARTSWRPALTSLLALGFPKRRTLSPQSDRELHEGRVQASSIRAGRSLFLLLQAHV